ncbi:hypothetical protein C2U52_14630 [Enterobacteriaceae bacterium ENNIH2]|jgi:hypothetical protein|nr:hypothetical protein C2U52_14630 [Enterobacteriaceae bacterium ENNIH2]
MHTASSLIRRVLQLQCQGYSLYCGKDQGVNTLFSGKIAAADSFRHSIDDENDDRAFPGRQK